MECKSRLRRSVLRQRNALSPEEIRLRSAAASSLLFPLPEVTAARTIMFFVSFGSEVDTVPMIRRALSQGKRVAAPRADQASRMLSLGEVRDPEADLAKGAYGIREPKGDCAPVASSEVDVVVVPAVVWGEDGHRLGYGGGYYDRFLAEVPQARRVGLGFELQVVDDVPYGPQDLTVDVLVTEARVRRFAVERT